MLFFFNFQLVRKWSVQVGVCQRNGDRANTNTISNFGEIQLVLWIRRGECARSGTDTLQTGEIHVMSADTSWFALSSLSWYTGSQLAGRPLIYNLAGKFQWKLNSSCLLICFPVYVRYQSMAAGSWFTTHVGQHSFAKSEILYSVHSCLVSHWFAAALNCSNQSNQTIIYNLGCLSYLKFIVCPNLNCFFFSFSYLLFSV